MPRPTKAAVLFDGTGTANTAFDSGDLDTSDYDALLVEVIPVGGAAGASTLSFYDSAFSTATAIATRATPATAAVKTSEWSPGAQPAAASEFVGACPGPVPALVRIGVGALGIGIQARIRVIGRRFFRGTDGDASYYSPATHGWVHAEV